MTGVTSTFYTENSQLRSRVHESVTQRIVDKSSKSKGSLALQL